MPDQRALANLLRTSTFRLAALYLIVFAVSVGAILGYVYWNTTQLLERQTDETIAAELRALAQQYRDDGLNGVLDTVRSRSELDGGSVYLLANALGRRVAGNLDGLPVAALREPGWVEFSYFAEEGDDVQRRTARAVYVELEGGFRLVVGRDVGERRQFAGIIRTTMIWALGIALLLGVGGGLLMSRNFLTRIDSIASASRAIMRGDLSERMPVGGTGDELDRLARALNDMLDQIERLMTGMKEVTTNVAHDLRTPLTRMRARIEDALRTDCTARHRGALEQTLAEADQLLGTFNALLSIARTEAGQLRETFAEVDVSALLEELCELYAPIVEEAGGTVTGRIEPDVRLRGDRQLLAQAVSNLVDNALKYGLDPQEGVPQLTLAVARGQDRVSISVADRGPGVPAGERERVKERFVRLDTSRNAPGSGLGLSLAAGVAKMHGGELTLEDDRPGLRAELVLPLENAGR